MKNAFTIAEAAAQLRARGVVGIPTETVYGLAADARPDDAVAEIFALKGRPSTNPLIVHVASIEIAERYAVVDARARQLFAAFSPGPLTIVLPLLLPHLEREGGISRLVTAGLNTVGIRIPDHPVALELLHTFDGPLAAPSANKSNHVSPTTAEHVRSEFGDAVPVLDGGPCRVGIESTVLTLAAERPTILRPGSVSREAIEALIGPVDHFAGHVSPSAAASSPGQHERHYAPDAPAFCFEPNAIASIPPGSAVLELPSDPALASQLFYARLRELDAAAPVAIFIPMPPDEPRWTALRDRIIRATRPSAAR